MLKVASNKKKCTNVAKGVFFPSNCNSSLACISLQEIVLTRERERWQTINGISWQNTIVHEHPVLAKLGTAELASDSAAAILQKTLHF